MGFHATDLPWILDLYPSRFHGHVHTVNIESTINSVPDEPHRLHLLRPSPKVMHVCKIILIAEWAIVTIPNTILSAGAFITTNYNFPYAYSISQRIEPAIYAFVCLMLSSLYIYYAYIMFSRYKDKKVRLLLIRLLYTNAFLIALHSGNIISEYAGGSAVQTGYVAFLYSFVSYQDRLY
jgi:hypothetical protein